MSAYAVAVVSGAKLVMVSSSLEGFPYFRFGLIVLSDCCEKVVDSKHNRNVENMKIYKKKELPRHEEEEFSVIVLTCDEHGETNLGFYNFDTEDWSFLSEADQSYRDSEFVWIYPPANQMKEFLIKSIKAERESAPPSSKENWFRKKTQPIKKKITLAFKKK